MDPLPFTWRELDEMDQASREEEWDRTASVMAAVVNSQRVKNPVKPQDLNPYRRARKKQQPAQRKEESPLLMFL